MGGKRTARGGRSAPAGKGSAGRGTRARTAAGEAAPDQLSARAMAGDRDAFLAPVRFHSTFDPMPLPPELLAQARIDEDTVRKLLGRLKRKEDSLLRPFPAINMVFWASSGSSSRWPASCGGSAPERRSPTAAILGRLWDAQMLRIARAEGCAFEEEAFLGATRRFRKAGGL